MNPASRGGRAAQGNARRRGRRASVGADAAINPATGPTGYSPEQAAFLAACESYRSSHGLRWMRAVDYLAVLQSLGYARCPAPPSTPSP